MDYSATSKLRTLARKTKIIKLYSYLVNLGEKRNIREFKKLNSNIYNFSFGDSSISMYTESLSEFRRVISYRKDHNILDKLLTQIKDDYIIWDVGANIGLYSLIAGIKFPRVKIFSFEPELEAFNRLKENIKLNRLNNIEALNFGLGNKNEEVALVKGAHFSDGNHSLLKRQEAGNEGAKETVKVFRGDDLIKDNYPQPNVIKIDVEGFELNVLKGMTGLIKNFESKCIICEIHFSVLEASNQNTAPKRIVSLIKEGGFTQVDWLDHSHLMAIK